MMDNFDEDGGAIGLLDERFELLSAYLDGEVTASERKQVEELLASDRAFQRQYQMMQRVQVAMPALSVPSTNRSTDRLADAVFTEIDRRRKWNLTRWIGGGAIAATLVTALAGISGLFGNNNSQWQMANRMNTPAPLMVALNDPILSIPVKNEGMQVPMASPEVNADEVN